QTGTKKTMPSPKNYPACKSTQSRSCLSLAILLATLFCQAAQSEAQSGKRHFNIPAQPLNQALLAFSKQSSQQLLYSTDLAENLKSRPLHGDYPPTAALALLLADAPLKAVATGTDTLTLRRKAQTEADASLLPVAQATAKADDNTGSDTTLPKVTVEADAENGYDPEYYADPYNKDYVIPNATAGTKTDTPIMETPLNVQVISKQVLKDQQVIRLSDAFKNVSGVVTRTNTANAGLLGGTQQGIFLRGFESQTFFRNGFRLQEGSASKGLANVESVEVLKGPAAILYGLVEPGGMVNVITKQPLATPYYGFTQQFGSYDLYRTTLDATGPITKNKDLLYRVNLSYENSGSFRDLVGKEDVFFAPVLKWNISPQTQVTFEMEYNHQHQGTDSGFVPFINGQPLNVPFSRNYSEYSPATTETIFGGFNWSHQFNDAWSIKHRFSVNQRTVTSPFYIRPYAIGNQQSLGSILDDFGLPHTRLDSLPADEYALRQINGGNTQNNTYSTNLDLVAHLDTYGLKHTLLLGGDYYRLDFNTLGMGPSFTSEGFSSYISVTNPIHPGTPFDSFAPSETGTASSKTDQYGLYIQDQIKLPYGFQVMGGIRYQYIDVDKAEQDAVTPRVGILWQPKSWISLYANYVESFGANSGRVFPGTPVPPTSSAQYEGGIKTQFFDGKLRASLAYFDLTKTNVAVSDPLHPAPACGDGCSIAIGEVRSRGPELDISGEILPGWNVIATWANTDIRVTKTNANGHPVPDLLGEAYSPGSRLPNIPRNTGSLWSTYEIQDSDYKGLTFGAGVTLRDRQLPGNTQGFGTGSYKIPGYATFDLMAGYSRQIGDAKVSIQLNVNNLLDKRYFTSLSALNSLQSAWVDFGTPRTFMGQVSVQY
ncbi:MAG: TonB-dependent siderophore receptor, partial [Methyloglobulus sp.]